MSPKKAASIFDKYALPFASLVDEESRWRKERELLMSLARTAGSGKKWVLDLACGSGFHARHLAKEGCKVTGIELSPAAIEAGSRLPGGTLVDWQKGDITRKPEGEYDLALLLGNTLSLFADRQTLEMIIASAAAALALRGVLAVQVLDYEFLRKHPVMTECRLELAKGPAIFTKRITPTESGGLISVQLTFPESLAQKTESEEVTLTEWKIEQLKAVFKLAGLALERCYGGMDKTPYQPGENRDLVIILRK
ncbi:MAG: class I SAM-dependent methyltransferase [Planctomycetes bacterium]|nr:class I SAM-dependent methyltransferase [Planctomycetota bacterium]